MRNLAGDPDCDNQIRKEFQRCGINIIRGPRRDHEVASTLTGKVGNFTFTRNWYYMVVTGRLPLHIAKQLYKNPIGKTDIRVAGDCGCRPPEEWTDWFDEEGNKLVHLSHEPEFDRLLESIPNVKNGHKFVEDPTVGQGFVTSYHIDSELGLYIFVQALKQHKLDQTPWPPIEPGTTVITTRANEDLRGEWQDGVWEERQWGTTGRIITHHDSHGLSYEVMHPDKSVGHYDPSEIEQIVM